MAHCTLNPTELAWEQVKGPIKANNHDAFNLTEVEHLVWEGLEVVNPEHWTSLVKHERDKVKDELAEYYSVWEFTFRIRRHPNDDHNEESSSESDTASDPESDSNDPMTDDDDF